MRSSQLWMRSNQVLRASSNCKCQSRNSPGFDPSHPPDTLESEGRTEMKQCWITYIKKIPLKKNLIKVFHLRLPGVPGAVRLRGAQRGRALLQRGWHHPRPSGAGARAGLAGRPATGPSRLVSGSLCRAGELRINPNQYGPRPGLKNMASLLKIAMLEDDIWVSIDEGVGPIGPRAMSLRPIRLVSGSLCRAGELGINPN